MAPEVVCQLCGAFLGELRRIVRDRQDRRSHLLDVGVGKAEQDAVRQHVGPLQLSVGQFVKRPAMGFAGQLPFDIDGQRRKHRRLRGPDLATQRPSHERGRLDAPRTLIEMRIGAIGDECIGRRDHLRR